MKYRYIAMDYYSTFKQEGNCDTRYDINLEDIIPSEISQTKGQIWYDSTYIRFLDRRLPGD